jgi:disulfide bond formation protein DsbB
LGRLALLAMLAILAAILTAAMGMQYAFGEIPCPLCLLQRYAMFGCCFGLILQLRSGRSERGTGVALIFAVLLLVIALRQTLLDIYPRPGHAYIGSAVLGLHLPVWSALIALALLFGLAARLALFGGVCDASDDKHHFARLARALAVYITLLCAINFVSAVMQCGLGECHTFGYRLLQ